MDSNFRIQFINGMLLGHDLVLPLGKFSLGESGDVWVKFQTKNQSTIDFAISEKGIELKDFSMVWIQGIPGNYWLKNVNADHKILPLNTPIDIDGVGLVFHPQGAELSTSTIFTLPPRQLESDLSTPKRLAKEAALSLKDAVFAILVSIIIACSMILSVIWYQKTHAPVKENIIDKTSRWIQEQKKQPKFSTLSFTLQPNGEAAVSGGCWQSKDLNQLYSELRSQGWLVRSSVVCNDELLKSVEYTLRLFGFDNAIVTNGEDLGSVHISGSIKGDGNWQKVEDLLTKMPGLVNWTVANDAQEQASLLMRLLAEEHFSNPLDFAQKNNKILITGRLNQTEQTRLYDLFENVRAQFPNNEFIYQNIDAISPELNIWPSPVIGIGGNKKTPYVELSSGLRLQLGSKLPSGYQIVGIDTNLGIRLIMQGKVINIPIDFNT